jgi:hypothetical protein
MNNFEQTAAPTEEAKEKEGVKNLTIEPLDVSPEESPEKAGRKIRPPGYFQIEDTSIDSVLNTLNLDMRVELKDSQGNTFSGIQVKKTNETIFAMAVYKGRAGKVDTLKVIDCGNPENVFPDISWDKGYSTIDINGKGIYTGVDSENINTEYLLDSIVCDQAGSNTYFFAMNRLDEKGVIVQSETHSWENIKSDKSIKKIERPLKSGKYNAVIAARAQSSSIGNSLWVNDIEVSAIDPLDSVINYDIDESGNIAAVVENKNTGSQIIRTGSVGDGFLQSYENESIEKISYISTGHGITAAIAKIQGKTTPTLWVNEVLYEIPVDIRALDPRETSGLLDKEVSLKVLDKKTIELTYVDSIAKIQSRKITI